MCIRDSCIYSALFLTIYFYLKKLLYEAGLLDNFFFSEGHAIRSGHPFVLHVVQPVSYTHLDVYKRQVPPG